MLDALDKPPFVSIPDLVMFTCIPTILIHQHFTQSLGVMKKFFTEFPMVSRRRKARASQMINHLS
jgi:hypothetical protein